jgi:hypothetical protein
MQKPSTAKVSSKVLLVPVADAIRYRKTCHFPNQRTLRDLNTQRLGLEMEKGRFVQGTAVTFCVLPDGTQYIVNGNHTLEAIAYSGKPQWLTFIFLQVDSFEEAAEIYSCFDVHKARTWIDALKATGRTEKIPMAKQVSAAVKLIMQDFRYNPRNVEANNSRLSNFDAVDEYEVAAIRLHEAMKNAPAFHQRLVQRQAVLAVALETVRHQPTRGVAFWGDLVKDDGLAEGDARKTLLRWLIEHPAEGKSHSIYLMARACAHAWNTWFTGGNITVMRMRATGKMKIIGTPWDGKKGPDADDVVEPAPMRRRRDDHGASDLPDIFETGMRITERGTEEVVLYRSAGEKE